MVKWRRTVLSSIAIFFSVGVLAGCQTATTSNPIGKVGNAANNTGTAPTPPRNGPLPLIITKTSNLTFRGTPTITSTSVTSAAPPTFVDSNIGYAALNGDVINTADGGKTWRVDSHLAGKVQALQFSDATDGLVAVQDAGNITRINSSTTHYTWSIYHTIDGGTTWTKVWTKSMIVTQATYMSQNFRFSMFGQVGYALLAGNLLMTQDAGQTWEPVTVSGQVEDATATGARKLWIVTNTATPNPDGNVGEGAVHLLTSTDGGKQFDTILQTPPMMLWQAKLAFDSSAHGLLLVKDIGTWETTAYWTTNGGQTWKHGMPQVYEGRIAQSEPVFGASGIAYVALDPGAAPFPGGMTTFDTTTGSAHQTAQNADWRDAQIGTVQEATVYVEASLNGGGKAILRSTDGGTNWSQVYPAGVPNVQVDFLTPSMGYGIGMDDKMGYIYKTSDGGRTWVILWEAKGVFPNAIATVDSHTANVLAYALDTSVPPTNSYNVELLATQDGGISWHTSEPTVPPEATTELGAPNVLVSLAASQSGLSMTIDGSPASEVLTSVDGTVWNDVTSVQSQLQMNTSAYANPRDLWISSVTQDHLPTKTNPSVHTSTIYQVNGLGPAASYAKPLWTLPQGWMILGMAHPTEQEAYVYATESLIHGSAVALFVTHDGGRTWAEYLESSDSGGGERAPLNGASSGSSPAPQPLNLSPSGLVVDLSFADSSHGYMLTANGLLTTADGGTTWTYVESAGNP